MRVGVQNVELMMGGVLAQYQKAFREFEGTAKERVRIASQYGFDVVAIEKRNADDRVKLSADLARAQVGSLQSLVDEITRGSLFEGSALDRIGVLNDAIGKAKSELEAGVEGAGDRLAGLYEDRLGASRDAYGTTGGYAADRSATIAEAQAAVARVNAQVAAANTAKPTSDPALAVTNTTLDEIADQSARIIAAQERAAIALESMAGRTYTGGFDLSKIARY